MINFEAARAELRRTDIDPSRATDLLRNITSAFGQFTETEQRELVIRLLDSDALPTHLTPILDDLARSVGLFPYISDIEALSTRDAIALEFHRPPGLPEYVFHSAQAIIYRRLLQGENVVLSAPTSFGKSLIIDAIIATGRFSNVVLVVPTLALVDEARRRLTRRFGQRFKVITHSGQSQGERNIFVSTQERLAGREGAIAADFLIVDEFYKLSPDRGDSRFAQLNQVLYTFARRGIQFYLLGPNISAVPTPPVGPLSFVFHREDFATVVTEYTRVDVPASERAGALRDLVARLNGPTVVYCQSPASARAVAVELASDDRIAVTPSRTIRSAVGWLSEEYHPDWAFVQTMNRGIGMHHGSIPRSWGQFVVQRFNPGELPVIVCTSTLIEGVNTTARNVIIFDNKVGRRRFDFFTYANIRGRSGRMGKHFIGHVYSFAEPPAPDLPFVDLPILSQGESTPDELLVQLDPSDLSLESQERLNKLLDESVLPVAVIRKASGVAPEYLINFAREIRDDPRGAHSVLSWSGYPSSGQLKRFLEVVWDAFGLSRGKGVASAAQLHYRLLRLQQVDLKTMILEEAANTGYVADANEAVENLLGFMRNWAGFRVPRTIRAADLVQRHVFGEIGLPPGDYSIYADAIENHFGPPVFRALEEYGLPAQLAAKLRPTVDISFSLDDALEDLKALSLPVAQLSQFENRLFEDFIDDA